MFLYIYTHIYICIYILDEAVMANTSIKGEYGQAEALSHIVRRNRKFMLERRSKAYKEIKARSTSYLQEDIIISDRDQDKKRKSNFNLLKRSPSKMAVDNAAKTAKTLSRQKSEEVKKTGTQGSDLYRWDDEDRESCEVCMYIYICMYIYVYFIYIYIYV
jgi:hypothetical protein